MEIIIEPNGSLLIPRGDPQENDFYRSVFDGLLDAEQLESLNAFFAMSEDSEQLYGERGLCG